MPKEKEFIVKPPEKPKSAHEYELEELRNDLSVFDEKERALIEKYLEGVRLTGKDQRIFDLARNRWWGEKYGFPYKNKVARNELLQRKYAPSKELMESFALQVKLIQAIKEKNEARINDLKKEYEEKYPDQLEGVTVLFELIPFLKNKEILDTQPKHEKKIEIFEELTQYQFLLTHFIESNSENKEFLNTFWEALERLSEAAGQLKYMHKLRRSVLSQVAILKLFKHLGLKPNISHPEEDAFHAIDLWADEKTAIQVKGIKKNMPALVKTDAIAFPGIDLKAESKTKWYNSHFSHEFQRFKAKLSNYQSYLNKQMEGYLVVIPYSEFDFVTGEPSEKIISFIKDRLEHEKE
jgi:hypothetical protein